MKLNLCNVRTLYGTFFALAITMCGPASSARSDSVGNDVRAAYGSSFVTFTDVQNHKDADGKETVTATLKLTGFPRNGNWQLGINFGNAFRPITSISSTRMVEPRMGDFYLIEPIHPAINRETDSIELRFTAVGSIKNFTDAPMGYFLVKNPGTDHHVIESIKYQTQLPPWTVIDNAKQRANDAKKFLTPIEGNPVIHPPVPANATLIVPVPVSITPQRVGQFRLLPGTPVIVDPAVADQALDPAKLFAQFIQPSTGYQLDVREGIAATAPNSIVLEPLPSDTQLTPAQQQEGYELDVTADHVRVQASSRAGFLNGIQSLRQLLPPSIYSHSLVRDTAWTMPAVQIEDYPRFGYRGLHLDIARHFVPKEQVLRLLDLMAIHKLNYFHWHLTDDEGWRIEINQYPQLTQIGSQRGYDPSTFNEHSLQPSFGSGAAPYPTPGTGYYTQDDIREVIVYAAARGITIVPEIDLPGHARALISSMQSELIDHADTSQYTSVQGYHDNVLPVCLEQTYAVLDNIFAEVADLFPGKMIHVGGDEVPSGAWTQSQACVDKGFDPDSADFAQKVEDYFFLRVQDILSAHGKGLAGWEEIAGVERSLQPGMDGVDVYVWNAGKLNQAYEKSKANGYKVVVAVAENNYFDLAYTSNPDEPGQAWAGYVDTFKPYAQNPIPSVARNVDDGSPSATSEDPTIKGIQGHLWSENINSAERLDYMAWPKTAGLAETAWSQATQRNWQNFSARMAALHTPRLDAYGVAARSGEFPVRPKTVDEQTTANED